LRLHYFILHIFLLFSYISVLHSSVYLTIQTASRQFSACFTGCQCGNASSLKLSPLSTRRFLDMLPVTYLAEDCFLVTNARPRKLHSADSHTLLVSQTRTNFGDRAISAAGPRVWNYLPTDLRQPDLSYSRFRQSLKTFFFCQWDKAQCESIPF